jgi:hypothetical protein
MCRTGTSHLLAVAREGAEMKAHVSALARLAASPPSASPLAPPALAGSSVGRVFSAGYGFLGHDCQAELLGKVTHVRRVVLVHYTCHPLSLPPLIFNMCRVATRARCSGLSPAL